MRLITIFIKTYKERKRQNKKWGDQRHPLHDLTSERALAFSEVSKNICNKKARQKKLTWRDILQEEVDEVYASQNKEDQITELIQVIAVCCAIIYDLIRKN